MKIYLLIGLLFTVGTIYLNMVDKEDYAVKQMIYSLKNYRINRKWISELLEFATFIYVTIGFWPVVLIGAVIDPE